MFCFDEKVVMMDKRGLRMAGFGIEAAGFGSLATVFSIDGIAAVAVSWMDEGLAGFSVTEKLRKRGVATQFLQELLDEHGGTICVVDPNDAMMCLLKKVGNVNAPDGRGVVTVSKWLR